MDLQFDMIPLDVLFSEQSMGDAPARDSFFAGEAGSAAGFAATLRAESVEAGETLEPAVMTALLLLAGGSWRAWTEEPAWRRSELLRV
jgi:hypothetical protein